MTFPDVKPTNEDLFIVIQLMETHSLGHYLTAAWAGSARAPHSGQLSLDLLPRFTLVLVSPPARLLIMLQFQIGSALQTNAWEGR